MKIILTIAFCWVKMAAVCAAATGDSLNFLTSKDTIFLTVDFYGEKIFGHTLERKQTLFSLTKFYGISMEELYFYNPELDIDNVQPGNIVHVPIPNRAILRKRVKPVKPGSYIPVIYSVGIGETLYRISRQYFKLPIDTLKSWNNLPDYQLQPGQKLFVGWLNISGIPDSLRKTDHPLLRRNFNFGQSYQAGLEGKKEMTRRGAAFWQKEAKNDPGSLYALSRDVPPGTIISIENPMNRKIIFAKVLGTIPPAAYPENIIIVLSSHAARLLGARDPKFYVEVKYPSAEEKP